MHKSGACPGYQDVTPSSSPKMGTTRDSRSRQKKSTKVRWSSAKSRALCERGDSESYTGADGKPVEHITHKRIDVIKLRNPEVAYVCH